MKRDNAHEADEEIKQTWSLLRTPHVDPDHHATEIAARMQAAQVYALLHVADLLEEILQQLRDKEGYV